VGALYRTTNEVLNRSERLNRHSRYQELLKLWMTLKDFESVLILLVLALGGSLLATKAAYD
jgi:hypothetical protein